MPGFIADDYADDPQSGILLEEQHGQVDTDVRPATDGLAPAVIVVLGAITALFRWVAG
jgi:hypothetical protein